MPPGAQLELVIFDCDGVLADSEPIAAQVIAVMLGEEGLEITAEQARRRFQGRRMAEVIADVEAALGREMPAGWQGRYEARRGAEFEHELRPVAGAREAVERVRAAGLPVCVASQGSLEKTRNSLRLCGLDDLFEPAALFSSDSVPRGKPHPDLFLAAARSGGAEPSACAVVEDHPIGVTAAVAAGMRAIGYAADGDEEALRSAGAEPIGDLRELPRLLGL
jgi:HAD superfamily hydrolase (TIGR01509 family)